MNSLFIQLHTLTALPPSCVNRDDLGRPKTCIFGAAPRLRVSSQSLKRSWRESSAVQAMLDGALGERTQRLGDVIVAALIADGVDEKKAVEAAREVAAVFGKVKKEGVRVEQLAFIDPAERSAAIDAAKRIVAGEKVNLKTLIGSVVSGVDIALFGRMFADTPDKNVTAAASVAHAITTHKAIVEDDYYTAVDDLKTDEEDAGAGFIGEAGFGSGVFYGYVNIDVQQLLANLGGDVDAARRGLEAFVEAALTVQPRGKRASFAHQTRASFALVEVGSSAPRSLASAFETPVDRALRDGEGLTEASIRALKERRDLFARVYGERTTAVDLNVLTGEGCITDVVAHAVSALGGEIALLKAAE